MPDRRVRIVLLTLLVPLSARAPDQTADVVRRSAQGSTVQGDAPRGTVTNYRWTRSTIFPGTERDYWIYVPAQYDGTQPACVMVFQDGTNYVDPAGAWKVPAVFDRLIYDKQMPVTIGVFINPGVVPAASADALPRFNRSFEYDALGDRYARFLLDEILPEVGKHYRLAADGNSRAIAGASSGAIAAFTVAWERPDAFRRVLSTIGTYVGLRGGEDYATLVRKTEPKPLRLFLEDGNQDLNIYGGDWWLANQAMASALQFAGYEVRHEWGEGGHDSKHGASILPEMLRWLWRDYPAPIAAGTGSKQPVMDVLMEGEPWRRVGGEYAVSAGAAANGEGEVFFGDARSGNIYRVNASGDPQAALSGVGTGGPVAISPRGDLVVADPAAHRIVVSKGTKRTVLAKGVPAHDLAVTATGRIYASDPQAHKIWLIDEAGRTRVVATDLAQPTGVQLTPDQSLLYVSDPHERLVYSYQVQADGSLAHGQPYCYLHVGANDAFSGADGMAVDTLGRLYVATTLGIQFCDQAGRVNGVISTPAGVTFDHLAFGGRSLDALYGFSKGAVFKRLTKATGVLSFRQPIKPPPPRL